MKSPHKEAGRPAEGAAGPGMIQAPLQEDRGEVNRGHVKSRRAQDSHRQNPIAAAMDRLGHYRGSISIDTVAVGGGGGVGIGIGVAVSGGGGGVEVGACVAVGGGGGGVEVGACVAVGGGGGGVEVGASPAGGWSAPEAGTPTTRGENNSRPNSRRKAINRHTLRIESLLLRDRQSARPASSSSVAV